ncbi:SLATT domain-containing protein [Pseudoalteromonas sp. Ld20]|uniref:SLATT domain-containing protein n=1 Tax=Pseudoalteromonas sp. Ld20 TaxID=649165 RepID=UPI00386F3C57
MDNKELLNNRIWRTKGSRFNAYRRLAKKNSTLTFVTSCSSIHLLAISILQLTNLVTISANQSQWLSFISIIISIIILAYGLYENGKEHGLKSERHHSCGIELDGCYSKLQFIKVDEIEKVTAIADKYNQITAKYLLNHETIDDLYFQLQNPVDFPDIAKVSTFGKLKIELTYKYYDAIIGFLFVIIPVLISLIIMLC